MKSASGTDSNSEKTENTISKKQPVSQSSPNFEQEYRSDDKINSLLTKVQNPSLSSEEILHIFAEIDNHMQKNRFSICMESKKNI